MEEDYLDDEENFNEFLYGADFSSNEGREDHELEKDFKAADLSWKGKKANTKINLNSNKPKLLIIEDDDFVSCDYGMALKSMNFDVYIINEIYEAILFARENRDLLVAIIIDIKMPYGNFFSQYDTVLGHKTGILLARELSDIAPDSIIIGLSNSTDSSDESFFKLMNSKLCHKAEYDPEKLALYVNTRIRRNYSKIRTFIVNGRNNTAALQLKDFLQSRLGFSEPIILSEKASRGLTLIEKFEYYAHDIDLVFSLLTPDDFKLDKDNEVEEPNVLIEYGYFLGRLGRKSGKVIMLYKRSAEIVHELFGITYIDVTNGIYSATEQIRIEIESCFDL